MIASVLLITGTDTDVGKTIATAALAATLATRADAHACGPRSSSVAVDKPVQTGVGPEDEGDIDVIRHLAGVASVTEGIRLRRPMAPVAAAHRQSAALPSLADHAARIERLIQAHDYVLVEGAGGVMVHLDAAHGTIADLAERFGDRAAVIVVVRAGLGTLNHTELTLQALTHRGLPIAGIVIGSWPQLPNDVAEDNRRYLAALPAPLLGSIPENSSRLDPATFQASAPSWFPGLL
jgi:dethiobiotin synthetase